MPLGGRGRRRDPDDGRARRARDRDRGRLRATRSRPRAARTSTRPSACCASRGRRRSTSAGRSTRCASTRRASTREAIHRDEVERCRRMAAHAAALLAPGTRALTHCNAGGLATGGYGSAVGALLAAWERGLLAHVWVDETRPLLQGARLTAWELETAGIPHAVIADSAAASLMAAGEVDAVLTGADRIAAQRRHREQDRHVRARRARAPPRHPVLRRRAELDGRPRDRGRRRDPDRGARPGRGDGALRRAQPGVRRHAGGADHRDRHRARRARGAVRRVARGGGGRRGEGAPARGRLRDPAPPADRDRPKPLLPIAGRPMLDWILDRVDDVGEVDALHVVTNATSTRPAFERLGREGTGVVVHDDGTTLERRPPRRARRRPLRDRARRARRRAPARVAGDNLFEFRPRATTSTSGAAKGDGERGRALPTAPTRRSRRTTASSSSTTTAGSSASWRSRRVAPTTLVATATYLFSRAHVPLLERVSRRGQLAGPAGQLRRLAPRARARSTAAASPAAGSTSATTQQLLVADNRYRRGRSGLPVREAYSLTRLTRRQAHASDTELTQTRHGFPRTVDEVAPRPAPALALRRLWVGLDARSASAAPRARPDRRRRSARRCGAPTAWPVDRCRECSGRRLAFASARSAVAYTGVARPLVRGVEGARPPPVRPP